MVVDVQLYKGPTLIKESKNLKVLHNKIDKWISFKFEGLNKIIFNEDKLIFQRINEEYNLHIKKQSECFIKLIKQELSFDIIVTKASYKKEKNQLEIRYKIESNDDEIRLIIVNPPKIV